MSTPFTYELITSKHIERSFSANADDINRVSIGVKISNPDGQGSCGRIVFTIPQEVTPNPSSITPILDAGQTRWRIPQPGTGDANQILIEPAPTHNGTLGQNEALVVRLKDLEVAVTPGSGAIAVEEFAMPAAGATTGASRTADLSAATKPSINLVKIDPFLRIDNFRQVGPVAANATTVELEWTTTAAEKIFINGGQMLMGRIGAGPTGDKLAVGESWDFDGSRTFPLTNTTTVYTLEIHGSGQILSRQLVVVKEGKEGNVGIGTATPKSKLTVMGGVSIGANPAKDVGDGNLRVQGNIIGNINADQINAGELDAARIPNLNADKINEGAFGAARIPNLNADKINAGTLDAERIPNLNADKINEGAFGAARIPNLNADKINEGTFGAARIPSLNASKINEGTFSESRIPSLSAHKISDWTFQKSSDDAHIFVIKNTDTGENADVLALQVGNNNPGPSNNFITFYAGDRTQLGEIEGRLYTPIGIGERQKRTIQLNARSADFAEFLEMLNPHESIEGGDIVGVRGGKISKALSRVQQILVVSSFPIIGGNMPDKDKRHLYREVAFIGQVPVKVIGKVNAGDYIVPSGKEDGTGIAVAAENLTAVQYGQVVGQAWESSENEQLKLINVATGIQPIYSEIGTLMNRLNEQQEEIDLLKTQIAQLINTLSINGSGINQKQMG